MNRVPDRGSLTDLMIDTLRTLGFPVGDAAAPDPAESPGWKGDPNAPGSIFTPYLVLTPATATITSGPFNDPQGDIRLPYAVSSFGVTRKQTESLANRARKAVATLRNTRPVLDENEYKIQQVNFDAIGGVGRVDQTSPSTFGEVDTFNVWLTKG